MAGTQKQRSNAKESVERRKQIIAVLMMVLGLLMLISLVSYSPADEARVGVRLVDLLRVSHDEELKTLAGQTRNRLGLLGAIIADALINGTIGYASIILPLLLGVWGWALLRQRSVRKTLILTNYGLLVALLFSIGAAVAAAVIGGIPKELSGIVGLFLADTLTKLLGKAGASIIVLTALFITLVFVVDLDVRKTIDRLKSLWAASVGTLFSRRASRDVMIRSAEMDEPFEERVDPRAPSRVLLEPDIKQEYTPSYEKPEAVPVVMQERAQEREQAPSEPIAPANEDEEIDYVFPSVELLDPARHVEHIADDELKANAELLRAKLANFDVEIENVTVTPGPVVTMYELVPASHVKISRIVSLSDDLALALAAKGIRIIAPIPGKSAVGVEIPNHHPSIVNIRGVVNSTKFRDVKANLPLAMGKMISGEVYVDDLTRMPHLLIAGATGSGKSVGINTILTSLLFRLHPSDVKFLIIDPKKIELTQYARLKNYFLAISPDVREPIVTTAENSVLALKSVEIEMEKRYDRLAAAGVRNIVDYNERVKSGRLKDTDGAKHRKIPYLVVVIDELADLMLTAAREVEEPIARLAQLARAVGIHLVLATQRPSVDVITGVIKANFPARIAYQVASRVDSRTILDMNGAEQLLGNGDMLYLPPGSSKPIRMQNAFISTDEVERIVEHVARQPGYSQPFMLPSALERRRSGVNAGPGDRDELFKEAALLVVRHQQGSVSLLQRRLKVGYSRAARLIDELEAAAVVGPFDGSKAREVLVENEQDLENLLRERD